MDPDSDMFRASLAALDLFQEVRNGLTDTFEELKEFMHELFSRAVDRCEFLDYVHSDLVWFYNQIKKLLFDNVCLGHGDDAAKLALGYYYKEIAYVTARASDMFKTKRARHGSIGRLIYQFIMDSFELLSKNHPYLLDYNRLRKFRSNVKIMKSVD